MKRSMLTWFSPQEDENFSFHFQFSTFNYLRMKIKNNMPGINPNPIPEQSPTRIPEQNPNPSPHEIPGKRPEEIDRRNPGKHPEIQPRRL